MLLEILKITFITIVYLILATFIFMSFYKQYIIDNWGEYKCQPFIIPLAGFFGYDISSNFQECLMYSTASTSSLSMSPMFNITGLMGDVMGDMGDSLNSLREGLSGIRGFFGSTLGSLMDRITSMLTYIQVSMIKIRSLIGKLLGVMTTLIYTLYTSIATMNSMIAGPIGTLAGVACFYPNTLVKLSNSDYRLIKDIKLGVDLFSGGQVISTMRFKSKVSLYNYNNTLVSGDHLVKDRQQWKRVDQLKIPLFSEKTQVIHCLTTKNNHIITYTSNINMPTQTYSDYIETSNYFINSFIKECVLRFLNQKPYQDKSFFQNYSKQIQTSPNNNFYVFGFNENTLIRLQDSSYKKISELQIDDVTDNQEIITGVISHLNTDKKLYNLNGILVSGDQIVYHQGNYKLVKSIVGLEIIDDHDYLYQVTTSTGSLKIKDYLFRDHHESKDKDLNSYIDNLVLEYLNHY